MNAGACPRARRVALATLLIAAAVLSSASTANHAERATSTALRRGTQTTVMKIRIDLDGTRATATLDDSAATRDFVSLLPLTLTLEDYNGTEKISDADETVDRGRAGRCRPLRRGIGYYAPWGNLAIFYKDFG